MKRGISFVLASIALAFTMAPTPAPAQQGTAQCRGVDGQWNWSTGGVVTIEVPNRAFWAAEASASPSFVANWVCDETGKVIISWNQGMTDTLDLSGDGNRLVGSNQLGIGVEGVRFQSEVGLTPAGPIPPRLVGTWLLEVQLPSAAGPVPVIWRIERDGRYIMDAGDLSHSGRLTAFGGEWELNAETASFADGGNYEFQNWATLVTRARTGVGRWFRLEPRLVLNQVELSGQKLPTNVPAVVQNARAVAASWRPDATLVSIEFDRNDAANSFVQDQLQLSFTSPATGAGLVVWVEPTGTRFFVHDVVNWRTDDIPDGFLDLPAAWAVARQNGLLPPLKSAKLQIFEPQEDGLILAWSFTAARGETRGVNLDAVSGTKLDGDLTGYVAAYNAQWQAATAGLRKLFQRPRRPSSSGVDFSSSGGGSTSSDDDYDSGDSGGSSGSDYDDAAQGAWSSGDTGAYDRIVSGTPTGDDCYRFGC